MTDSNTQNVSFAKALENKVVVVDTSSLLMAGVGLLTVLPKCQLVIPTIVVTELESKRTSPQLGFLAREWIRLIEELRVKHGIELSRGVEAEAYPGIELRFEPNHSSQKSLPEHLQNGSNDSTILAVAENLVKDSENEITREDIVILSNDTPMRLSATMLLKFEAHEFNATQVIGAKPFDGRYIIEMPNDGVSKSAFSERSEDGFLEENSEWILDQLPKNASKHAVVVVTLAGTDEVAEFSLSNGKLDYIQRKLRVEGIVARTIEQSIAYEYLLKPASELPIVSLGGPAGTGKTLVTLSTAIKELKAGTYQKIIAFRSLHEMGEGQEMGYLPGGVDEKMSAWAGAIYDALDVLAAQEGSKKKGVPAHKELALKEKAKKLQEMVEVSPITYLRGRSLSNTFLIIEEAQNFSRRELLNILSRVGEGSKIVLTWDADQVDNKYIHPGKKADIWSIVETLKGNELFAHITLNKTERSKVAELASKILSDL